MLLIGPGDFLKSFRCFKNSSFGGILSSLYSNMKIKITQMVFYCLCVHVYPILGLNLHDWTDIRYDLLNFCNSKYDEIHNEVHRIKNVNKDEDDSVLQCCV